MHALLCDAIRARRLLRFVYDGYERVVEPHAYGISTASNEMLSCWLVGGWSASEAAPGWRNYLVRDMVDVHVLAESFDGPRAGYNPAADALRQVYCRLDGERETAVTEVRALLDRIDAAWRRERWEELGECFDERMVIVTPDGAHVEGRAAAVTAYRAFMEHATLVRHHAEPTAVDVWDGTSVATVGWDMVWEADGTPRHDQGREIFVCRRGPEGSWQAVWRTVMPLRRPE